MIAFRYSDSYDFGSGIFFVGLSAPSAKQYLEGGYVSENVYLSLF